MRITTTALILVLAGFGLCAQAMADDGEIATFEARWPETPMRQPTGIEAVRLIASVVKDDITPVLKAKMLASTDTPARCSTAFCGLLSSR